VQQPIAPFLETHGLEPCQGGQLLLKRALTTSGQNRQFVDGAPTTLQILAELGDWLVDLHGPHDHQSLLRPSCQLELLDAYGGHEELRSRFTRRITQRRALLAQREALVVDESTYERELSLLRHQVQEIAAARFQPEEETQLQAEYHRTRSAASLLELSQAALQQLNEDESSLMYQAGRLGRTLQELRRLDPEAAGLGTLHEDATASCRDLLTGLRRYADSIQIEPDRLRAIEERLNLLQSLKRKYGPNVGAILTFGNQARTRLDQLEGRGAELDRLRQLIARNEAELTELGSELSRKRHNVGPRLTAAVNRELNGLGFQQSQFELQWVAPTEDSNVHEHKPTITGHDRVEFLFSPNLGEPLRPLRAIASSGEMARVMLALKSVLAAHDSVPVLIFDEVDANVGGETANALGEKMCSIGRQRQVLCITHLANVASRAGTHFVVTKTVRGGRTLTDIQPVVGEARLEELVRMLGGPDETARRHAARLLKQAVA